MKRDISQMKPGFVVTHPVALDNKLTMPVEDTGRMMTMVTLYNRYQYLANMLQRINQHGAHAVLSAGQVKIDLTPRQARDIQDAIIRGIGLDLALVKQSLKNDFGYSFGVDKGVIFCRRCSTNKPEVDFLIANNRYDRWCVGCRDV